MNGYGRGVCNLFHFIPCNSHKMKINLCEIWGSHGDEYEDDWLSSGTLHPDHRGDGGSKLLWNVDHCLQDITVYHLRRQPSLKLK
jgi:hypothetical protein